MAGYYDTHVENPFAEENPYRSMSPSQATLPAFEDVQALLPRPFWEDHSAAIDCYWKVWEIAFRNLRNPTPGNGFVSPYIDTAFNANLFMWDSAFILMFARYGARAFDFQQTLDNFYAKQHPDGFICREIREADGSDCFFRTDPPSTGPNVMPWAEWDYFLNFGDRERLARVFPALVAFHQWFREYRSWPDGGYWACGWACGMDNQPRVDAGCYNVWFSHAHQVWVDTCFQQILSARLLARMAEALGRAGDVADMREEADALTAYLSEKAWDEETAFYCDLDRSGARLPLKTIGAYWALLADAVPPERLGRFTLHLQDPAEFNRPHRVPSLSADHSGYGPDGAYWRGGVWPSTNYMVLRGLRQVGKDALAHEIACNHLENVVEVFRETGTVWENYAPESANPGSPAKGDFVGWGGVGPVAVLLEHAFGLRPDVPANTLTWDVRLPDAHGVEQYPFGEAGLLDLKCGRRSSPGERPVIEARTNVPVTLKVRWAGGMEMVLLEPPERMMR